MTTSQIICAQIRKYQLTLGLIFSLFSSLQSQDLRLELKSCNGNSPIENAYVLNEASGKVLGYSNRHGQVIVRSDDINWPLDLKIYKMSALDTTIVLHRDEESVCLKPAMHQLSTFEVASKKEGIAESFRQYLAKTIAVLKDTDTTHFYSFAWRYTLPDSNWSMSIEGVIKMPFKSYSKTYSGGFAGEFCQMKMTLDSSFYNSKLLEDINLNHIGTYFSNFDFVRKRSSYRKKISDEMVLKKISASDLTTFVYSAPLNNDWKLYVGYPVFDSDSILVQNESDFLLIDTIGKQKTNFVYLEEYSKLEYALINGSLALSSIELDADIRHKTGVISTVYFSSTLISEPIHHGEKVSIMKGFRRQDLDELKKVSGFDVIVE